MKEIKVTTKEKLQILDITEEIEETISGVNEGVVVAYVPHTTAAITIQEHDTELWEDLLNAYQKLVPIKGNYKHNAKYSGMPSEQNAHSHILSSMIKPFILIPVVNDQLQLGTWQKILFIELDGGRHRTVKLLTISKGDEKP
ncbi:MAG: YjbQ family protein [Candidatus Korarchaeota archaeon]|nr:YjbQ family protein [Candidatus Korarchaeota archaeon]NIU82650.1 YjbQ family protein [Candidatus Thorarchaeota archaeon]NIW13131.1 YjbQ family protein [Candidatus Thorarchaeota archaeon]NIW51290.1 YjbQ family protein [Candidatus Korarchaeota archaeon]